MKRILITAICILLVNLSFAGNKSSNTTFSVMGTVIDASTKKPLADVSIVAVSGSTRSEVITTNAQGQFKIPILPQGTYTLKFSKDDYRSAEKREVMVKTDNPSKLNVELIAETLENNSHRSFWDKYDLYL